MNSAVIVKLLKCCLFKKIVCCFFSYIKMSKDLSAKCYQINKKRLLQKRAREKYQKLF